MPWRNLFTYWISSSELTAAGAEKPTTSEIHPVRKAGRGPKMFFR
jgi:hypothetical protein